MLLFSKLNYYTFMMAKINRVKIPFFWNPDILIHEALTNKLGNTHTQVSHPARKFCFAFGDVYL